MSSPVSPAEVESSILRDYSAGGEVLAMAFGGWAGNLGIPPFEFFGVTSGMPMKRLFVRDPLQLWYHGGVPDVEGGFEGLVAHLREEVERVQPRRVVTVGNCMGGYGAILFGWLLGVDYVLAFAPCVYITQPRRLWNREFRWIRPIAHLLRSGQARRDLFDLRWVLDREGEKPTAVHVHYPEAHRLDRAHALRLGDHPNVTLHPHAADGHNLVRQLKQSGALGEILREAVVPDARPHAATPA